MGCNASCYWAALLRLQDAVTAQGAGTARTSRWESWHCGGGGTWAPTGAASWVPHLGGGGSPQHPWEGHGCPAAGWSPPSLSPPAWRAAQGTGAASATCEAISSASIHRARCSRGCPVPTPCLPPPASLPEAAPAAAPRAAPAATRPPPGTPPPPPGAARRRGGPGYISRHVVAAPPPRPGTCPWKITASPPAPTPGRAAPVPGAPPGCSGGRPGSARRAPALPRYRADRAGRATDARPPRIPLPPPSRRGAAPGVVPGAVPGVAPARCRSRCPRPRRPGAPRRPPPRQLSPPLTAPVLPRLPAEPGTRCRRRCVPLTVPMPPPGPWRRAESARGGAAPDPLLVSVPVLCQARSRRRRWCRVNESLEVGGGWRRLSPPPPRSAPRAATLPSAPLRYPHPHRGRRAPAGTGGVCGGAHGTRGHAWYTGHAHGHTRARCAHGACTSTCGTHGYMGTHGYTGTHRDTMHLAHLGRTHGILGTHGHSQPTSAHRYVDTQGHMQACTGTWPTWTYMGHTGTHRLLQGTHASAHRCFHTHEHTQRNSRTQLYTQAHTARTQHHGKPGQGDARRLRPGCVRLV